MQALIPPLLVYVLDNKRISSRRTRGLLGIAFMGTLAVAASAGFLAWLEVNGVDDLSGAAGRDWSDKEWPGVFVCYILFGAVYAGYQMCTEYTLSSTTNDPEVLAHVAGMFKFYSSLGMMISFLMAGVKVSFLGQISMQLA